MTIRRNALDRLRAIERQQRDFRKDKFVAVRKAGSKVVASVAGIVQEFDVEPASFEGWGIFKAEDHQTLRYVEKPNVSERNLYVDKLPTVEAMLLSVDEGKYEALAISASRLLQVDHRFFVEFCEQPQPLQQFDTVIAAWTGAFFVFVRQSIQRAMVADQLRKRLRSNTPMQSLSVVGLTKEQRKVYMIALARKIRQEEEDRKLTGEGRVEEALKHAGASLDVFTELADSYRISWRTPGSAAGSRSYTTTVNKENLRVISPGICLTDERNGDFYGDHLDLASLVGVVEKSGQ